MVGMPLLPWQVKAAHEIAKIDENGRWRSKDVSLIIARQNGKTHFLRILILTGLFIWDERLILGTAQNREVARETFKLVADIINAVPELREQCEYIRLANGQEEIKIKSLFGDYFNRYKIVAPNAGSRGHSADRVIIDELREQKDYEAHAAIIYTMQARPNAQFIGASNAGDATSVVLNAMRERALKDIANNKPSSLLWLEWSGRPNCDLDSLEDLAMANPSLGHLISIDNLMARLSDPPAMVRTEQLCQWVDSIESPFDMEWWADCHQPDLELSPGLPTWLAVDISWDRCSAALVGGQQLDDKRIAVGLIQQWESGIPIDIVEIARSVADWAKAYQIRSVAFLRNGGMHLAPVLQQHRIPVSVLTANQYAQACDELLAAMSARRLVHAGQPELTQQISNVVKSPMGDGWVIGRRDRSAQVVGAVGAALVTHFASKPVAQSLIVNG